jgi:Glycosyl transferase family 2
MTVAPPRSVPARALPEDPSARPLVSVVVTFYNQEEFVAPALASVLAQDYAPLQIIVVDDESTDGTAAACARFLDRITYVRRRNGGPCAARNEGLRHAQGSLIAFLDGDDLWESRKIAAQVAAALRCPEAGMVVADGEMFSEGGILRPSLYLPWIADRLAGASQGAVATQCYQEFVRGCLVSTPSQVMIRREVFASVGPWRESIRLTGDHELYLRVTMRFPVVFMRERLMRYRYIESSLSGPQPSRAFRWGLERVTMLRIHRHEAPADLRPAVGEQLRRTTDDLARDAYHRSVTSGRWWAAGFLCRLAWYSRQPHRVLAYLIALGLPDRVQRLAAWVARTRVTTREAAREAGDANGNGLR